MNLKPFVASLFILGFASTSAMAMSHGYTTDASAAAQLNEMKAKIAQMESILNVNQVGHFGQRKTWTDRVTISGMINVDGTVANRAPVTYSKNHLSEIAIRNANLFVDAEVSDWSRVHLGFLYQTFNRNLYRLPTSVTTGNSLVDEAYIVLGNFTKSPLYLRAGRQYIQFGNYQRFQVTDSLTQLLSQTQATALDVGFVASNGFNFSLYTFRGLPKINDATNTTRVQNYGANIGIAQTYNRFCYNLSVGYIRNILDADYIRQALPTGYVRQISGLAVDGGITVGAFDLAAHYVSALQNFAVADGAYTTNSGATFSGAKPSAWGVDAGYSFATLGHSSRIGIGYQGSRQAYGINRLSVAGGLPRTRWLANYTVNVARNTDVGVEVYNDRDYGVSNLATGRNALVGVMRLAVRFN